ncbi:MAG: hypothetical protein WC028_32385 [Candidatus Obscuribacterales bacterium]
MSAAPKSATSEKIIVLKAFFPASAARSFHVSCEVGDILVVEKEHDHGTMCTKNGVMCFLLEEEVYKFCRRETA